jgi:hypothetical protein
MAYCPRCGGEYQEGYQVCAECGVELQPEPTVAPESRKPWRENAGELYPGNLQEHETRWRRSALALILVALTGFYAIYYFSLGLNDFISGRTWRFVGAAKAIISLISGLASENLLFAVIALFIAAWAVSSRSHRILRIAMFVAIYLVIGYTAQFILYCWVVFSNGEALTRQIIYPIQFMLCVLIGSVLAVVALLAQKTTWVRGVQDA